jgi:hypothetical protein
MVTCSQCHTRVAAEQPVDVLPRCGRIEALQPLGDGQARVDFTGVLANSVVMKPFHLLGLRSQRLVREGDRNPSRRVSHGFRRGYREGYSL